MKNKKIVFIGSGNMAHALIAGLIANDYEARNICATNPSQKRLDFLKGQFNIETTTDNYKGVQGADIIIFAIKPDQIHAVCKELKDIIIHQNPLVISIAISVTTHMLTKWLSEKTAIVRAMPNIASSVGAGATGLYANHLVSEEERNLAEMIFRAVGLAVWLEQESHIDIVTAISGSGPAYFFLIMEAIQKAAVEMGLPDETVRLLICQTTLGASRLTMETEKDFETLRLAVTSSKGTTEAAIGILENKNIREIFKEALTAAAQRSKEIATQLNKD